MVKEMNKNKQLIQPHQPSFFLDNSLIFATAFIHIISIINWFSLYLYGLFFFSLHRIVADSEVLRFVLKAGRSHQHPIVPACECAMFYPQVIVVPVVIARGWLPQVSKRFVIRLVQLTICWCVDLVIFSCESCCLKVRETHYGNQLAVDELADCLCKVPKQRPNLYTSNWEETWSVPPSTEPLFLYLP